MAAVVDTENRCPVCRFAFTSKSTTMHQMHINKCLDRARAAEKDRVGQEASGGASSVLAESAANARRSARREKGKERVEDSDVEADGAGTVSSAAWQGGGNEENLGGFVFCPLCQKDVTPLSDERRLLHINRCCDKETDTVRRTGGNELLGAETRPGRPNIYAAEYACFVCGKDISQDELVERIVHLKACAGKHGVQRADGAATSATGIARDLGAVSMRPTGMDAPVTTGVGRRRTRARRAPAKRARRTRNLATYGSSTEEEENEEESEGKREAEEGERLDSPPATFVPSSDSEEDAPMEQTAGDVELPAVQPTPALPASRLGGAASADRWDMATSVVGRAIADDEDGHGDAEDGEQFYSPPAPGSPDGLGALLMMDSDGDEDAAQMAEATMTPERRERRRAARRQGEERRRAEVERFEAALARLQEEHAERLAAIARETDLAVERADEPPPSPVAVFTFEPDQDAAPSARARPRRAAAVEADAWTRALSVTLSPGPSSSVGVASNFSLAAATDAAPRARQRTVRTSAVRRSRINNETAELFASNARQARARGGGRATRQSEQEMDANLVACLKESPMYARLLLLEPVELDELFASIPQAEVPVSRNFFLGFLERQGIAIKSRWRREGDGDDGELVPDD